MPRAFEWKTYMKWSEQYNSDIIHLDVTGSSIIVLNSVKAANDLLLKRSSIYSDRFNAIWRARRRLFQHEFNPTASLKLRPKQIAACHGRNGPPGGAWTPPKFNRDLHKPPEYFRDQRQDHVGPNSDPKSPKETGCKLVPVYYALQLRTFRNGTYWSIIILTCLNGAPV
ncbi:hypothetical protein C8J57DRAFT_1584017 [Mycena rebaudengoi]|nr:hypothetical protein C8J57DRAFT_1584017 [Mycena rebaudengoi]